MWAGVSAVREGRENRGRRHRGRLLPPASPLELTLVVSGSPFLRVELAAELMRDPKLCCPRVPQRRAVPGLPLPLLGS